MLNKRIGGLNYSGINLAESIPSLEFNEEYQRLSDSD